MADSRIVVAPRLVRASMPPSPSISIITVCRNSEHVIRTCLVSVAAQTHPAVEHIVVDGASTDQTVAVVREFPHVAKLVSEPDQGIYDAMNKGIALATGEVVGILNADDYYPDSMVLAHVARIFDDPHIDATIGDVQFVCKRNPARIVRYCSAARWHPQRFRDGIMPPHPAFFVRRRYYDSLGTYRTDFQISSDFDLLVRFLHGRQLRYRYAGGPLVSMRSGGTSNASLRRRWQLNRETWQACRDNGIQTSPLRLACRYFGKAFEFLPGFRSGRTAQ